MRSESFENKLKHVVKSAKSYENRQSDFLELWPLFGTNKIFGMLNQARVEKSVEILEQHFRVIEQFSKIDISGFLLSFITQGWVIGILEKYKLNTYQKNILDLLRKGEKVGAFCLTEEKYGSSYVNLLTKGKLIKNKWDIRGEKLYITNGAFADFYVVVASTSTSVSKMPELSLFLLSSEDINRNAVQKIEFMGNKYSGISKIIIECKNLADNRLLGKSGSGFFTLPECLQIERMDIAIFVTFVARECLKRTIHYLSKRTTHEGKSLLSIEAIQRKLIDMHSKLETIEAFIRLTATSFLSKRDCGSEIMIAKIQATEIARDTLLELIQLQGAVGYMKNNYILTMFNCISPLVVGGGANDALKSGLFKKLKKHYEISSS